MLSSNQEGTKVSIGKITRELSWFHIEAGRKLIMDSSPESGERNSWVSEMEGEIKMEKALMKSRLLSGGLEERFLCDVSRETRDEIRLVTNSLSPEKARSAPGVNEEDEFLRAVIYPGTQPKVDAVVDALQYWLQNQKPVVPHAAIQGSVGLQLCRAAFATMLKLYGLTAKF